MDYNTVNKITKVTSTPVQVYDKNKITDICKNFLCSFETNGFITDINFRQYFAVKATPNVNILAIMKTMGFGFDCSSIVELQLVSMLIDNFNMKDIKVMYTSNYTSVEDLKFVIDMMNNNHDIEIIINLDDLDGLYNLMDACVEFPKTLCFRINPTILTADVSVKSNVFSGNELKFGMSYERIIKCYKLAKLKGVENFGIHAMPGSCVMDEHYWKKLVDFMLDVIYRIYNEIDIKISFLDIGGGFGIPYKPDEKKLDMNVITKNIRQSYDEHKNDIGWDISLFTEAGRYITGPAGYLIASCKSIKEDNKIIYGLDACMANLMRPGMYGSYHKIKVPRLEGEETIIGNVVGTLCENNDWFAKDRELPQGIRKNDIFVIYDTGAHGHSMGFNYNGKLRCAEYMINNNELIKIRDEEKYSDMINNLKIEI